MFMQCQQWAVNDRISSDEYVTPHRP